MPTRFSQSTAALFLNCFLNSMMACDGPHGPYKHNAQHPVSTQAYA